MDVFSPAPSRSSQPRSSRPRSRDRTAGGRGRSVCPWRKRVCVYLGAKFSRQRDRGVRGPLPGRHTSLYCVISWTSVNFPPATAARGKASARGGFVVTFIFALGISSGAAGCEAASASSSRAGPGSSSRAASPCFSFLPPPPWPPRALFWLTSLSLS